MATRKVILNGLNCRRMVCALLGLLVMVALGLKVMCPLWHGCSRAEGGESKVADQLVIEPKTVDFGRVNSRSGPLALSFTVANRGDRPIEITRVRSSCGCTVAKLSKYVVPPRDQIAVSIKVNTLGRRGEFKNRVLLDVSGQAKPIVVPIQGTIIQDLWFNGPMIQCFLTDSAPKVEKIFEVHTVEWPAVRFDWNDLDKALSIQELSRSKIGDETVIEFRLRMDAPATQSAATRYIRLTPLDKRINSLKIPVVCYLSSLRKDEAAGKSQSVQDSGAKSGEAARILQPDQINLGVVLRGEDRRFEVSGPYKLVDLLKVAGLDNMPEDTEVELHPVNDVKNGSLGVTIRLGESIPLGLLDGRIRLTSPDGRKYSVGVLGFVGPKESATESDQAKHRQEPDR